jgi:hypothetical protein
VVFGSCCSYDTRKTIRLISKTLEVVALDIFIKNRWIRSNKLCSWIFISFVFSSIFVFSVCAVTKAGELSIY